MGTEQAQRTCDVCGASLEGKRRDARYCSAACRQYAYRRRKERGDNEAHGSGTGGPSWLERLGDRLRAWWTR